MSGRYQVRQQGSSAARFETETGDPVNGFATAQYEAIEVSKKLPGYRWEVYYEDPEVPFSKARIGFALNGQWRWRG